MLNNKRKVLLAVLLAFSVPAFAQESVMEIDVTAAEERSVFQQIADFEQERILLQLEKEKMQLMLDLERMTVEQARLRADASRFSGQESEDVRQLESEIQRLERENQRLERDKERMEERMRDSGGTGQETRGARQAAPEPKEPEDNSNAPISQRFKLIEIVGVGRQLQATIEEISTGQKRRVWVGRGIEDYDIQSISLDDGVVFVRDGITEALSISSGRER